MFLADLRDLKVDGAKADTIMELCSISSKLTNIAMKFLWDFIFLKLLNRVDSIYLCLLFYCKRDCRVTILKRNFLLPFHVDWQW